MILLTNHGPRDFQKSPIPIFVRRRWEVFGVHEGRFGLLVNSRKEPLYNRGPTLWILSPQLAHGKTGDGTVCQVSHFFTDQMPPIIEQLSQKDGWLEIPLSESASQKYFEEHQTLCRVLEATDHLQPLRAQIHFHQLLILALESLPKHRLQHLKNQDQIRLEPAFLWFRDHMAEQPKLEAIARQVHLSESHFRRLVREQYDKSSKTILMNMRMEKATGLLRMNHLSIESIARSCGFSSHAAFSRAFARYHRCTPHKWRMSDQINKAK
jgi:AraC-like DNA-binding protein